MDVVEARRRGGAGAPGATGPRLAGWWVPVLAGSAAFWLANLVISLTPVAADYREALSIPYGAMLVEAALGGVVLAAAVTFLLARYSARLPGRGVAGQALVLGVVALVVVTLLVEVPSKLGAGVGDPGHWLLVATIFNAVRLLAMVAVIGLVLRARPTPRAGHGEAFPGGRRPRRGGHP